ncbi:MAG: PhoU domain-containing protein [Nitrososphaerota archaeon]|nr:AbrB/MazE/SpoVT family DNA-binding domain-containing protein [Candidatus Bathyarchaeota archaeon]MDW8023412.1 PhoU domain-containing protein [Nitrososphaerota archaeon]
MEIRKLQQTKGGNFILSLPREWIEKMGLGRGEEIAVFEEEDGSLRLYPTKMEQEKPLEVVLALENYPEIRAVEYCVKTYYTQGINKISIKSKKNIPVEIKKRLKLLRMELPGIEVADERADAISFYVIIDPAVFLLESLIEKTSSFSLQLQEDSIKSILTDDFQLAREVIERAIEAMRYYRMTIRQVALSSYSKTIAWKVGVKGCRECVIFALVARDLSRLIYHSYSIARHFLSLDEKAKINPQILSMIEDLSGIVHGMQRDAVQSFLKRDIMLAISTMERMNAVRKKEETLLTTIQEIVKDTKLAVVLSYIARDLRRIAGHSVAIADDAMNRILGPP